MDDELSRYLKQLKELMEDNFPNFSYDQCGPNERLLKVSEERIRRLHHEPGIQN